MRVWVVYTTQKHELYNHVFYVDYVTLYKWKWLHLDLCGE